jgi:hypothetical protein
MFYNKAYLQNTDEDNKDHAGGCFRFGMRRVQIGVLSILTSSFEIIVSGEGFISETLLASSNIFVLLVFTPSIST